MKKVLNFIKNTDGNFAPLMALMALPIFGGVALSVDYSNLTRLKTELRSAADATCVPVAKMFLSGDSTDAQVKAFGAEFFAGNFNKNSRFTSDANLEITLPNEAGTKPGGNPRRELMCEGKVTYHPIFGPVLAALSGTNASRYVKVIEESVMRMRNVAEIALVMDASGSMNDSTLSGGTRMSLLKEGSKKLVSDLVAAGQQITNATDSVKFSVVPFSASVNVGANNRTANWMDQNGVSPIHHENLNWGTMGA
ncbi:MAG: pilus assembly protein TadG-related protein, partial [Rhizobiaceae bacterium]